MYSPAIALGVTNVPNFDTLVVTLATGIEVALENRQLEEWGP